MSGSWLTCIIPGNGGGPDLYPAGIQTCRADWMAFVCFDCNRIWFFLTSDALQATQSARASRRKYGTGNGNSQPNTGYGVLLLPAEIQAKKLDFTPNEMYLNWSLSSRAVMEVRKVLTSRGYGFPNQVSREEDIAGTDLIAVKKNARKTFQVKSRGAEKSYVCLFIQTHEANPEKIYQ